jgi:hypothetical protein
VTGNDGTECCDRGLVYGRVSLGLLMNVFWNELMQSTKVT